MIRLGKKTQYALVALLHLDRIEPGSRVSTHELSQHYDIPEPHLGKVLQKLSRAGLLRSVQGVLGGYELACPLDGLSLGDLMQAIEPPVKPRRDLRTPSELRMFPSCYVQGMARDVERKAIDHLYEIPLLTLLSDMEEVPRIHPVLERTS